MGQGRKPRALLDKLPDNPGINPKTREEGFGAEHPQKVKQILAFWSPKKKRIRRAGVWSLQKWNTRFWVWDNVQNRRAARSRTERWVCGMYGALGSRVRRSKAALRKQPVR